MMHTKDEAVSKVETYLKHMLSQNRVVSHMGCDSDPIFKGADYTAITEAYNVVVSYSAPYTPTQNTMAERRWGIAAPAARAMLHTAPLVGGLVNVLSGQK